MKSQVLSQFSMPSLTVAAFIIFLLFFIGVVYWTFRKGSKDLYDNVSKMPLSDGVKHGQ